MIRLIKSCTNQKGQATLEFAILGIIILMLLSSMVSQAYFQNQAAALEMYTFRKAMALSREGKPRNHDSSVDFIPRATSLTVIRDIVVPSFFTGLYKQRLISSASVDTNSYILYQPMQPYYVEQRQVIEVNDQMMQENGVNNQIRAIEVPPTKMEALTQGMVNYPEGVRDDHTGRVDHTYVASAIQEVENPDTQSDYTYSTVNSETPNTGGQPGVITSDKDQRAVIVMNNILFVPKKRVEDDMKNKQIYNSTEDDFVIRDPEFTKVDFVPKNVRLESQESLSREKIWQTPKE